MTISLNKYLDHTLLKADASVEDIMKLCQEALAYGFASVCVNPCYAGLASNILRGSGIKAATVIGFPLGASTTNIKVQEVKAALDDRALELDVMINLGALKSGQWEALLEEMRAVVEAAEDRCVKFIVETALLTTDEKRRICQLVMESGAQFIKTSTGFAPQGATVEDIRLFKSVIGEGTLGIKAAGGISTAEQALALIEAGATRIGTSHAVAIMQQV